MDPALLMEHKAFKRKALATAFVENKKKKNDESSKAEDESKKKIKSNAESTAVHPRVDAANYRHMSRSSQKSLEFLQR